MSKKETKDYDFWKKNVFDLDNQPEVSTDDLKNKVMTELQFLNKLTVEEYTLFRKWKKIHKKFEVESVSQNLFGETLYYLTHKQNQRTIAQAKENIWSPDNLEDYQKLSPTLVYADNNHLNNLWNIIRIFTSTMEHSSHIGRSLKYIVQDDVSKKYLGVIEISSDFMDLAGRDNYIGWSREIKTDQRMINYTAIGSTLVPTQPLGYNYVGGKLLALLCLSKDIQKKWKEQYGDLLAGVTTTSLYGSFSQYNGLKYWKHKGHTQGTVSFTLEPETIRLLRLWLKQNYTKNYWEWYVATIDNGMPLKRDHTSRSYAFTYRKLDIPKEMISNKCERGVYFCPLYTNTNEFLRKELEEKDLIKRFNCNMDALSDLWKNKYARKRIQKLQEQDRVSDSTLFYDKMLALDNWDAVKAEYLNDVGR